jgi:hypothetical protein
MRTNKEQCYLLIGKKIVTRIHRTGQLYNLRKRIPREIRNVTGSNDYNAFLSLCNFLQSCNALKLVGKDSNQKLFIADLNRTTLLGVLGTEAVCARLQKEACLDEAVEVETLLLHWIITIDEGLKELR